MWDYKKLNMNMYRTCTRASNEKLIIDSEWKLKKDSVTRWDNSFNIEIKQLNEKINKHGYYNLDEPATWVVIAHNKLKEYVRAMLIVYKSTYTLNTQYHNVLFHITYHKILTQNCL